MYTRRRRHHIYLWQLPFIGMGLMLAGCAWLCVWTLVWSYEAYVGASWRAYKTTRQLFGWPR